VPALASQFKKVYPQLEPPSEWSQTYDVTPVSDDGTTAQFRLVRKKNGRIDHVDVASTTGPQRSPRWPTSTKMEGPSRSSKPTPSRRQLLIKSQSGKVDLPQYHADVASSFTNYKLNVRIDQQVFATD